MKKRPLMIFKQRAFTLIEVMVSLAILAISLGVIVKGTSEQASQLSYLKNKTNAYFIAENKLAQLKINAKMPSKGSIKSIEKMAGQDWAVEQIVTETAAKDLLGEGQFMGVRIEVKKDEADETPLVKLQTYLSRALYK